jgi:hypothetical protein
MKITSIKLSSLILIPISIFLFNQFGMTIGIPQIVSFLSILTTIIIFFIYYNNFYINKKLFLPLILIVLIIFIDKYKDFIYSGNIVEVVSLAFSILYILFLFLLADNKIFSYKIWKYIGIIIIGIIILQVLYFKIQGIELYVMNRDISFILLFFMMYIFFKQRILFYLLFPFTIYFLIFLTEARTQVLGLILFILTTMLINNNTTKKTIMFYFYIAILFIVGIIAYGVYFEYYLWHSSTQIFTGRGMIWYYAVDLITSINYFMFGAPSDVESLAHFFTYVANENFYGSTVISEILKKGHFHNIYIHTFFNSGFIGILLFFYIIRYFIVNNLIPYQNIIIMYILLYNLLFFGRSFYGFTILAFLFSLTLIVPYTEKKDLVEK